MMSFEGVPLRIVLSYRPFRGEGRGEGGAKGKGASQKVGRKRGKAEI